MKDLTMQQAKARVKKLANGKYHSVRLEHTDFGTSTYTHNHLGYEKRCGVYVDGTDWYTTPTFCEAIAQLEAALKGD